MNKESQHTKIEDILKKAGKESSFTAPEGYFDSLTDRVMENVKAEKKSLLVRFTPILRIAAVLVTGVLIALFLLIPDRTPELTADIQLEDVLINDDHFIDNLDEEYIIELLAEEDVEADTKIISSNNSESDDSLADEALIESIMDEGFAEEDYLDL